MLDIDGDGLLDRVTNASTEATDGQCRANWKRNLGPTGGLVLDAAAVRGRAAAHHAAAAQVERHDRGRRPRSTGRWPPIPVPAPRGLRAQRAGHGVPELVNAGVAVTMGQRAWRAPRRLVCSAGLAVPSARGLEAHFRTYLAYRWLDMDADGLVDLVAAVHGDIGYYDIVQGNGLFNGAPRPPEPDLFGPWPACPGQAVTPNVFEPGQVETCKDVDASCMAGAWTCPTGGPCTINWATVNACLAQAPPTGCHALTQTVPSPQRPPTTARRFQYRGPYTRCEGLYPWFIYKNTGNGTFASSPVIKYQPVPLESDTGDSSITGGLAAQYHGVVDFDGDGVLDALVHPNTVDAGHWFVWLGDGTGGFGPRRYTFPTRPAPRNKISGTRGIRPPPPVGSQELRGVVRHQRRWAARALAHERHPSATSTPTWRSTMGPAIGWCFADGSDGRDHHAAVPDERGQAGERHQGGGDQAGRGADPRRGDDGDQPHGRRRSRRPDRYRPVSRRCDATDGLLQRRRPIQCTGRRVPGRRHIRRRRLQWLLAPDAGVR